MKRKYGRYRPLSAITPLSPLLRESRSLYIRRALWGHLSLARISNSPTVVSNTLVGAAAGGVLWPDGRVALVAIAMVCFYIAGMYLNDLLDYVSDCSERPRRPLPAGLVTRSTAAAGVVVLFAVGCSLLWLSGMLAFLCGLLLMICIIAYDCWHKNNPLSPLLMGLCRGMVYFIAFFACSAHPFTHDLWRLLIVSGLLLLYVIGLTAIAKTERGASIASLTVIATLFLPLLYIFTRLSLLSLFIVPLALFFAYWVRYSITFIYRQHGRQVGRTVGQLIAGIALVDSLLLAVSGSIAGVLIAFGAFGLTLFLQQYVKGT